MEPDKKEKLGPIIYTVVCVIAIWFFYWFGATIGH